MEINGDPLIPNRDYWRLIDNNLYWATAILNWGLIWHVLLFDVSTFFAFYLHSQHTRQCSNIRINLGVSFLGLTYLEIRLRIENGEYLLSLEFSMVIFFISWKLKNTPFRKFLLKGIFFNFHEMKKITIEKFLIFDPQPLSLFIVEAMNELKERDRIIIKNLPIAYLPIA